MIRGLSRPPAEAQRTTASTPSTGLSQPRVPDREAIDAIFLALLAGCQRAAPDATGVCSHSSAHRRHREWAANFVPGLTDGRPTDPTAGLADGRSPVGPSGPIGPSA